MNDGNVLNDFKTALLKINVACIFAWYDIKLRYRRTKLGLMWISITVLIESLMLSLIFGNLFHQSFISYYPYIFSGRVVWQLIANILNESILAIPSAKNYILNHNISPLIFIIRVCIRNLLIFLHSSLFVILICSINNHSYWNYLNLFLVPVVAILIIVIIFPFALILALTGTRFRDIIFLMPYCMQILFYLTPIVWKVSDLSNKHAYYLSFNPISPLLEFMRSIFLNDALLFDSLTPMLGISVAAWLVAILIYSASRRKLCYWIL